MAAPRILLVEDEPAIADTLLYALRTEGFAPEWHSTGNKALAALEKGAEPALVVLDVGLPDVSGFDLCKTIRARHNAVPILFLTARNSEIDRIVGLEIGGDDYVTKPFSPREIAARAKAILRRTQPVPAGTKETHAPAAAASEFVVDTERCEVSYRGVKLELTRYEYRLLGVLIARPGRVFSRDELMTRVWEDPGASLDRTVDAHIKTLRAKLRAIDPEQDPIQTHRGLGYALRAAS
ncbi:MAG TPA: two-component system response regulator CreB [Opitutaceae bacterium]